MARKISKLLVPVSPEPFRVVTRPSRGDDWLTILDTSNREKSVSRVRLLTTPSGYDTSLPATILQTESIKQIITNCFAGELYNHRQVSGALWFLLLINDSKVASDYTLSVQEDSIVPLTAQHTHLLSGASSSPA